MAQHRANGKVARPRDEVGGRSEKQGDVWHSLVHFDDLARWQQDNQHIQHGYRKASYSYRRSFHSMLHWHNESVNIWTHIVPGILSIPCGYSLYQSLRPRYDRAEAADIYAMSCFFLGAALCLGMSGIFHTLSNHSPGVAKFWNQLDYVGIAFMIWGSFIPSIFYGFWCEPTLQKTYWSMITIIGAMCIAVTMLPKFRTPTWRPFRAIMFIAMGLSALFPVLHGIFKYGLHQTQRQIGLKWTILQGVLYIVGAALYAMRFPESTNPGRYDKFGASHQIFHVCVVLAAMSHLRGLLKAFDYRHGYPGAFC